MKKGIILAVVVGVGILAFSQRIAIIEGILGRAMVVQMGTNTMDALEDGLHLALCGAGGPMPSPKASGPCVAVVAGKKLFVVDAGTDGLRNLQRMAYPVGEIEAVLLTHFHSDHIDGLGELGTIRWASGDVSHPLAVYGPPGVEDVVAGFNAAYAQDFIYRHEHHGDAVTPLEAAGLEAYTFALPEMGRLEPVFSDGDIRIEALVVDHAPVAPAVGYKFTYRDRSLLITGDTAQSDNIVALAQGVDLLVHEALAPNLLKMMNQAAVANDNPILAKIFIDVLDYHASPVEAAETARDADVGHLLYYHIVPPLLVPGQEAVWLNGAGAIFPEYTVGEDGVAFSLPAGSDRIEQTAKGL